MPLTYLYPENVCSIDVQPIKYGLFIAISQPSLAFDGVNADGARSMSRKTPSVAPSNTGGFYE